DVYERPADEFVARFIGSPGMNILIGVADAGRGKRGGGGAVVRCGSLTLPVALAYEGEIHLGLRPEHVTVCGLGQGEGDARGGKAASKCTAARRRSCTPPRARSARGQWPPCAGGRPAACCGGTERRWPRSGTRTAGRWWGRWR